LNKTEFQGLAKERKEREEGINTKKVVGEKKKYIRK